MPVCLALLLAVLAIALAAPDGWAKKKGPRCSPKLCREGIAACVAIGEKRRACKRGIVRACKVVGPGLCLPPTTTTTIPPVPTTLDVAGVWALSAVQTLNTCAIEVPASLDGRVTIRQNGSVLSGDFGQSTLAGQFTAPDAFLFALPQFCSPATCCGTAALTTAGLGGTAGALFGSASFSFTGRCNGLTCSVRWDGTLTQGADPIDGGGGGGPTRPPKR